MDRTLTVAGLSYALTAVARDGQWVAFAERADSGGRFGIECGGPTAPAALDRLAGWLEWQSEHAAALDSLQHAERAYHRTIAESAFGVAAEGAPVEFQHEALAEVEAARVRLDEVRARRPK